MIPKDVLNANLPFLFYVLITSKRILMVFRNIFILLKLRIRINVMSKVALHFRCFFQQPQCQKLADQSFVGQIGFTCPRQKTGHICSSLSTSFEQIWQRHCEVMISQKLRDECDNANFNLDSAEDIKVSYEQYTNKCSELWESFFNCRSPYQVNYEHLKCKTNTIFRSFQYTIHNGRR